MESICSLGMCCTMLGLAYVVSSSLRRRFRKYARRKLKSCQNYESDIQGEESIDSRLDSLECEVHIIHIPTSYFRMVEPEAPPPDYETAAAAHFAGGDFGSKLESLASSAFPQSQSQPTHPVAGPPPPTYEEATKFANNDHDEDDHFRPASASDTLQPYSTKSAVFAQ